MYLIAWTSLISSGDLDGVSTDIETLVKGIIGVGLIILGAGLIIRAMGR